LVLIDSTSDASVELNDWSFGAATVIVSARTSISSFQIRNILAI